MVNVLLDTSPLHTGHAIRGIGTYTRLLIEALQVMPDLTVQLSGQGEPTQKPDLIHYPFFDLFKASLPVLKKTKTVVTIHDVIPLLFPQYYPVGKRGTLAFYRQKLLLNTIDAIITDSAVSKHDIISYLGVSESKISVVPLAANPAISAPTPQQVKQIRKKYQLPKSYILYVGDINYNKNIPQLIKTLKLVPAMHLALVGKNFYPHDIPEWRWIEAQIALSDVAKQVSMITDVPGDDAVTLSALYSGATAYIQPSLYEGFGLPVLEAMACNVPVIASNRGSLPEVSGGVTQLCEPTAEGFAQALHEVLGWSETKLAQVLRAQRAWVKHFSWANTATQTASVYRQVLGVQT